jgi:hypothetical protein
MKTKAGADCLLQTSRAIFGASSSYVGEYQFREDTRPCYNCNAYGHKQNHCKKQARCGFCLEQHRTSECPQDRPPKCLACTLAHPIWSRECIAHPRTSTTIHVASTLDSAPRRDAAHAVPSSTDPASSQSSISGVQLGSESSTTGSPATAQ